METASLRPVFFAATTESIPCRPGTRARVCIAEHGRARLPQQQVRVELMEPRGEVVHFFRSRNNLAGVRVDGEPDSSVRRFRGETDPKREIRIGRKPKLLNLIAGDVWSLTPL